MVFKADQSTCLTSLALRVQFLEPKKGKGKIAILCLPHMC